LAGEVHYIRIAHVPPGEAPLWVREKWVGLELPIADAQTNADRFHTSGVLTGPRNRFLAVLWGILGWLPAQSGYGVDVAAALDILERTAPEAALWWRENVPRLMKTGRKFLFQAEVCEPVEDPPPNGDDGSADSRAEPT
jgi:hypothetical protein